ncbi:hypothetical protein E1B28_003631 [Marasmius oreades]|uniref:Uncharacterized protein n=1 Tax=Marasmius oreades TaxID=181124 RepID=A0A9P7UNM0_9AGAR|nr:uncharacterized protein E1B28_003631 [Marasmius oreades]KAG7086119.1 hypothetical protein E1B28_003631 [Marasmius oreades]
MSNYMAWQIKVGHNYGIAFTEHDESLQDAADIPTLLPLPSRFFDVAILVRLPD